MGGESPVVELYDSSGNPLAVQNGVAIPASTPGLLVMGSDGTNSRYILIDGSSRQIVAGAGTAGTPAGGVITIQGDPSGTPIPISGNITASNASVGTNDAAIPGFSTLIGGSDGTNLRPLRTFDLDSGGGTQWVLGVGLRKSAGGGSVEFGTSSDPIRIDPTGTTTQPVSGTVTANQGGSWTVAGTGNFTVVQSTASNLRAQLASETTTGTAVPSTAVQVGGSDGTNLRPLFMDSSGRLIVIGAAANGATVTGNPVLVAGSDGTNARSIRTATDGTVRIDPTGTTVQPISISGTNLDAGNSSTTPLTGSATFTGTGIDTFGYATVGVFIFADQAGTLKLQFSSDNSNWDDSLNYSIAASDAIRVTCGPQARYFRVQYVNGSSAQSVFRLQTIEYPVANYPSTVPVSTVIDASDDAIITKSVITGKTTGGGGGFVDVKVNPSGTLTVDASGSSGLTGTFTANQGTSPWVNNITQFGGSNIVTGTGTSGAGIPRVTVSNDSNILATQSGTWTVAQGAPNSLANKWPVQITDGTNTMPTGDAVGRAIFEKITDGTNTAGVDANNHLFVSGKSATGVAPSGNPVSISGIDASGLKRIPLTTTTGAIRQVPDSLRTSTHNNATITSSGSTIITNVGYAEVYLIVNVTGTPTGTSPTLTFTLSEVDPGDQTTAIAGQTASTTAFTAAGLQSIQLVDLNGDTVKVSWTITGASASFTGVYVNLVGHVSGNAIEGQADVGVTVTEGPVIVGGVDNSNKAQYFHLDSAGNLQVVATSIVGTAQDLRITQNIASATTVYLDYTVPAGKTYQVSSYYLGGFGAGRSTLAKHTSANTTFIANGDFENGTQVAAWAAVTGTFTAPSPDSNSTQFQTGAASMRWIYSASATALARKQTFSPTIDLSGYRYLRVKFFNDAATGTTRTISIIVTSGTPTRTYSLSGTLGTSPFTANTWITLTADLDNPTSSAGTGFDITAVSAITLQMQDAANKTGTVYWDTLRQEDQLDIRHRLYTSAGDTVSAPLNPSETFNTGEGVYLIARNTGNTINEFTAIVAGTLV